MVKVSIVMPMYNQEKYIAECLNSALGQSLKEIEIIVVNDGSTDRSLEIVQKAAKKDPRVIVIDKENGGYGAAMNAGFAKASGEYIGILETDDYVPAEMYETLYDTAKKHGSADFVKADFYRFSSEGGFVSRKLVQLTERAQYYNRALCPREEREVFTFPMNTWSGIYRREFLEKYHIRHNETPGASYQDNGFWFQTFCFAEKAVFLDKPLYMNRRDNPSSSVYDPNKVYCVCNEYAYIDGILKEHPSVRTAVLGCFWLKKYHNYLFTLNRIAYKFKREFAERMQKEFSEGAAAKELDLSLFTEKERDGVALLLKDVTAFLQEQRLCADGVPGLSVLLLKTDEDGICKTFASIANQTYGNIQIIAAAEKFTEKEREFLSGDGRVQFLEKAGESRAELLNAALAQARGKYVHLLCSGAIVTPTLYDTVQKRLCMLSVDAVVLSQDVCLESGAIVRDVLNCRSCLEEGLIYPSENEYLLYGSGFSAINKIFSLRMLRDMGIAVRSFDENGESPYFVMDALSKSRAVAVDRSCGVKYFRREVGAVTAERLKEVLSFSERTLSDKARQSYVNVLAGEVFRCAVFFDTLQEGLFAEKENLFAALDPIRYAREQYFNGFLYDFILRFFYQDKEKFLAENALYRARRAQCPAWQGELLQEGSLCANGAKQNGLAAGVLSVYGDAVTDLEAVLHSVSFRVGRMLTYFPRKVRGVIRFLRAKMLRGAVTRSADSRGKRRLLRKEPLVSIIIPTYNTEKYIEQCLDSLLAQTYQNIEIICVDDGSTDSTWAILDEYKKRSGKITLLKQDHAFAGVARNNGFAAAKGEYTLFLDSDDFFERDFVESLVIRAEGTGADITVCRCSGYNQQTNAYFPMEWSVHEKWLPLKPVFSGRKIADHVSTAFVGWAWDKLYRTSFIKQHKLEFQGLRSSNDAYFVFTSLALARRISFVNRIFIRQRRYTGSSISQTRSKSWNNCLLAADKIYEDWKKRGIYSQYERSFCNWFVQFTMWHYATLDEGSRKDLLRELCGYAEKYGIFRKKDGYYYYKNEHEQFCKLCGREDKVQKIS